MQNQPTGGGITGSVQTERPRLRPRRSNLAVPGSNPRFLEKAKGLPADQVFLDLEDACAPLAKPGARKNIVAALNEGGWGEKIRVVRVNDWTTHWTYRDVVEVVEGAGANLDAIDAPFPNYQDPEAYRVACDRAAAMGFLGKWAIHPSQVEIANTAFSPTPDEIAHAERLVAAYRAAESAGKGASGLDGMLVDAAHLRHAATVAKRAALLGLSGKERTE